MQRSRNRMSSSAESHSARAKRLTVTKYSAPPKKAKITTNTRCRPPPRVSPNRNSAAAHTGQKTISVTTVTAARLNRSLTARSRS